MVDANLNGLTLAELLVDQPEPYRSAFKYGALYFKYFNNENQKLPMIKFVSYT